MRNNGIRLRLKNSRGGSQRALGLTAQGIENCPCRKKNLSRVQKEMLERRTGLPVDMWDERLTTVEADRTMMKPESAGKPPQKYVDMIAAVFILQGYLDYLSHQKESQEN